MQCKIRPLYSVGIRRLMVFLWFHHELLLGRCPSSEREAVGDIPKVAALDLLLYFPYDLFRDLNRLHQGTFCK
jgi:hypothetical protein